MSLLFMDSFDHYLTADLLEKWTSVGSASPVITAGLGRRGTAALDVRTPMGAMVQKTLGPVGTTAVVGFGVYFQAYPTKSSFVRLFNGPTSVEQVNLQINPDGTLSICRGLYGGAWGDVVLGTTTIALATGAYNYIEWKTVLDDTVGSSELRINGSPSLTLANVDTNSAGGNNAWTSLIFYRYLAEFLIDDLYVLDGTGAPPLNGFLGDCRIDVMRPVAEGAYSGWTPSAGTNNALMVDDPTPDDDATCVTATSTGMTDTHTVEDITFAPTAVQINLSIAKSDAGSCSVAPVLREGGTDAVGQSFSPSLVYAYAHQAFGKNPLTDAPWTAEDFNAMEFGYRRTS